MMEWLSYKALNVSNLKQNHESGQALYASVLMKQFIVDTIIEVFDRYIIELSVKACRAGPDTHKIYRRFSSNSTMEEVIGCIWE